MRYLTKKSKHVFCVCKVLIFLTLKTDNCELYSSTVSTTQPVTHFVISDFYLNENDFFSDLNFVAQIKLSSLHFSDKFSRPILVEKI